MEETVRQELLAKTRQALEADDWSAVERIWQPWIEQGEAEAEFQLAYHYFWPFPGRRPPREMHSIPEDERTMERMEALVNSAAAKDHPDAHWALSMRLLSSLEETTSEYERLLLRAGELGSIEAQGWLGNLYATGDWSWPIDLTKSAHWYRLAAERGDPSAQYELGFFLLLGEGVPKNTVEGLMWLERSGELEFSSAYKVLVDCYEKGFFDVPVDAAKGALWRNRLEEYQRLNPVGPHICYSLEEVVSESSAVPFFGIEGVTGFSYAGGRKEIYISFDPARITPAELDEKVRAAGIAAVRKTEPQTEPQA